MYCFVAIGRAVFLGIGGRFGGGDSLGERGVLATIPGYEMCRGVAIHRCHTPTIRNVYGKRLRKYGIVWYSKRTHSL